MRAVQSPSASIHDSKKAPQPHAATDESVQVTLDVEVLRPAWPRWSARKRLKRFSPDHTIRLR